MTWDLLKDAIPTEQPRHGLLREHQECRMGNHGEGVDIKKSAVAGRVKLLVKIPVNISAKVGTSRQKNTGAVLEDIYSKCNRD